MLTNTKVKAQEYGNSDEKCSLKDSLTRHFWGIHLGETPYACKECGKWYASSKGRKRELL